MNLTELRAWKFDQFNQLRDIRDQLELLTLEVRELRRVATEQRTGQLPPLLDVKDVAAYLKVSERMVYRLMAEGEIVAIKIGGMNRFDTRAVDVYLRSSTRARRRKNGR